MRDYGKEFEERVRIYQIGNCGRAVQKELCTAIAEGKTPH